MVDLGDSVKDRITGLTGIVIARTEWLYGCVRISVQPQDIHEGKVIDYAVLDEAQLEVLVHAAQTGLAVQAVSGKAAGERPDAGRRRDPV